VVTGVAGVAWSRDGESLIYNGSLTSPEMTYLWRVGIHDLAPPQRIEIGGPGADSPSVSIKGNRLLFARQKVDFDIWRYQESSGGCHFAVRSRRRAAGRKRLEFDRPDDSGRYHCFVLPTGAVIWEISEG
jgi:hypothetical protein